MEPANENFSMKFLSQFLAFEKTRRLISEKATGTSGSMKNITKELILNLDIPTPPLEEQNKIAEILFTWDSAIKSVSDILYLREIRFGHLQNALISGKLSVVDVKGRFDTTYGNLPSHWKFEPVGSFLTENKRVVPKPKEPYTRLGIRSHCKGTFLNYNTDPQKISLDELHQVKANELIVNITFAWEGAIAITCSKDEDAFTSHRFPTYTISRNVILVDYLKYLIRHRRMIYDLGLKSPGGAGRNRVLSKKDFLKIKVPVPPVEEQKIISEILKTQEDEVLKTHELLMELETQKKGLMQQLLTGKARVKH